MGDYMDVSIIVPCHNNARLLAKTLSSFASQDKSRLTWEVILIDNNSSDSSVAKLQLRFRSKFNLTLVEQPQLKHPFALCRARNIGLQIARGKWIVGIDADIIPNRSYIKTLASCIKTWGDHSVIASCERQFISTEGVSGEDIMSDASLLERLPSASSPSNYGLPTDRRLPAMLKLPAVDHPWDYMHGCNVVYRRQDALAIGGYDESYDGRWGFEDIDFAYRMITQGKCKPLYAKGLHVYHQDLEEDVSTNRTNKADNPNWWRVCELIPGYKQYKTNKYQTLSKAIET